jgi:hypothetical protein
LTSIEGLREGEGITVKLTLALASAWLWRSSRSHPPAWMRQRSSRPHLRPALEELAGGGDGADPHSDDVRGEGGATTRGEREGPRDGLPGVDEESRAWSGNVGEGSSWRRWSERDGREG